MRVSRLDVIKGISKGAIIMIITGAIAGLTTIFPHDPLVNIFEEELIGFHTTDQSSKIRFLSCSDGSIEVSKNLISIGNAQDRMREIYPQFDDYFVIWGGGAINVLRIEKICESYKQVYVHMDPDCLDKTKRVVTVPHSYLDEIKTKLEAVSPSYHPIDCD